MTGCLDELMEKATEMGLDECWDEVSDKDKLVLEPIFRSNPQNKFIFRPTQFIKEKENVRAKIKGRHLKVCFLQKMLPTQIH